MNGPVCSDRPSRRSLKMSGNEEGRGASGLPALSIPETEMHSLAALGVGCCLLVGNSRTDLSDGAMS